MATWAESQMYHAGQDARRDGLPLADALCSYHSHLTSQSIRKAFIAGWRGDPELELIRIRPL